MALNTLAAYYKFQSDGSDSLNLHNGTSNNVTYTTGKIGNGAGLSLTASRVQITGKISNNSQGTICAFVKFDTMVDAGRVFGYGGDGANAIFSLETRLNGANYNFAFTYRDGAGANLAIIRGSTNLSTGTWYFVTWSGSGSTYQLTVNAVAETLTITSGSNHGKWWDTVTTTNSFTNWGGLLNNGITSNFLRGTIDEASVFDSVLSIGDISILYNNGTGRTYPFSNAAMFAFFLQP